MESPFDSKGIAKKMTILLVGRAPDVRPNTNGVEARAVLRCGKGCADNMRRGEVDDESTASYTPPSPRTSTLTACASSASTCSSNQKHTVSRGTYGSMSTTIRMISNRRHSLKKSLQMCMLTRTHVSYCYLQGIVRVVFTHACQSFVPFCNMCVTKRWWEWVRANVRVSY